jgi:hypothetical protein
MMRLTFDAAEPYSVDRHGSRPYGGVVKRLMVAVALGYAMIALYARVKESLGLLKCACYTDCWCKQPGLSFFRWIVPARFHHHPNFETWKQARFETGL